MILKHRMKVCKHCGELHDVRNWPDNHKDDPWPRSDHPAPYIQSDSLGPDINGLWHPIENRLIDSKSEFRRVTKEHNCVEVGNDRPQDASSFCNFEPQIDETDILNDVCDVLREHDVSVDSGELV